MGLLEKTFVVTDDRYDVGAGLQEYNGTYSVCEAKKGEKKTFLKWVYPQKFDKDTRENYPGDKPFPKSVAIANGKEEVIRVLTEWLDILEGRPGTQPSKNVKTRKPNIAEDDIPF